MPGTNAGTGQPIAFLCGIGRREGGFWRGQDRFHGDYVRTGRTRGMPGHGHGVGRIMSTAHEYRCRCGHVGWTRHHDIMRYPVVT